MTVTRWSPYRDMVSLRQAMDRLFEDSFVRRSSEWGDRSEERRYQLPVDVYTTPEDIVVKASLPGVSPDEVEINLEADSLTIRAEIQAPTDEDYVIRERGYGVLSRTLTLNVPVNADKAGATFENGVLTLTLPKAEELKPKRIEVKSR